MNVPELKTPKELAQASGWSERRIRSLLADGELKHVRIGVNYLLPADAIEEFVSRKMFQPCPESIKDQNSSSKLDEIPGQGGLKSRRISSSDTKTQELGGSCTSQQALRTSQKLRHSAPKR